jgi:DNA-binding response OmpR family regulator
MHGAAPDNPTVTTVLVVDDEPTVRDVVVRYLEQEGYRALAAADGAEARALLASESLGLVILDLMLPGVDGLTLCREIRARSQLPVIMITALGEEADRLAGLEVGADDYLTKPFSPRELVARVRAVLRRAAPATATARPSGRIELGALEIDADRREARRRGEALRLTTLEFDLLWFLATNPDRVFSRDELMAAVWGYTAELDTGTVTVHVRRLRQKVEQDPARPRHLETVWGSGYRWTP